MSAKISEAIASRIIGDEQLRNHCAAIYAAVISVPRPDRMDVTAVALRALVDTGSLEKSGDETNHGADQHPGEGK